MPAAVVRAGVLAGLVAGVFGLAVELASLYLGRSEGGATLVHSSLVLLIIGGAARPLGQAYGRAAIGFWMGMLAGGIGELLQRAVSGVVLAIFPLGHVAVDPGLYLILLLENVALGVLFGGAYGALGAWSAYRFGPPSPPAPPR